MRRALGCWITVRPTGQLQGRSLVRDAMARAAEPADANRRLVVAVAPDEEFAYAEQILRAARRFADALGAHWTVVCVETPSMLGIMKASRDSRLEVFRLAESLGA